MKIINSINKKYSHPCNITIGFFDGIHLGHQLILKKLKEKNKKSVVITFKNHPLSFLDPKKSPALIYDLEKKLKILKNFKIDVLILLDFDEVISKMSYTDFLKKIKSNFNFYHIIASNDIKIGKDKKGNKTNIKKLEKILNFKLEFVKKIKFRGKIVSSSYIRELIKEKKIDIVEKLLNRKYIKKDK